MLLLSSRAIFILGLTAAISVATATPYKQRTTTATSINLSYDSIEDDPPEFPRDEEFIKSSTGEKSSETGTKHEEMETMDEETRPTKLPTLFNRPNAEADKSDVEYLIPPPERLTSNHPNEQKNEEMVVFDMPEKELDNFQEEQKSMIDPVLSETVSEDGDLNRETIYLVTPGVDEAHELEKNNFTQTVLVLKAPEEKTKTIEDNNSFGSEPKPTEEDQNVDRNENNDLHLHVTNFESPNIQSPPIESTTNPTVSSSPPPNLFASTNNTSPSPTPPPEEKEKPDLKGVEPSIEEKTTLATPPDNSSFSVPAPTSPVTPLKNSSIPISTTSTATTILAENPSVSTSTPTIQVSTVETSTTPLSTTPKVTVPSPTVSDVEISGKNTPKHHHHSIPEVITISPSIESNNTKKEEEEGINIGKKKPEENKPNDMADEESMEEPTVMELKPKGSPYPGFNRKCNSYFDCDFHANRGAQNDSRTWFKCDGKYCVCELLGYIRDDEGDWSVAWSKKSQQCTSDSEGGPCGVSNGMEIHCKAGYQCIDNACEKPGRTKVNKNRKNKGKKDSKDTTNNNNGDDGNSNCNNERPTNRGRSHGNILSLLFFPHMNIFDSILNDSLNSIRK